jgi:chromosome segregation ATPase
LEHFRDASREQREQEARQHENQVQFLQHELHSLKDGQTKAQLKSAEAFQELARMTSELGAARRELTQQEKLRGQVQSLNERLAAMQNEQNLVNSQLGHERQQTKVFQAELEKAVELRKAEEARAKGLEADLLTMKVRLETSEELSEKIQIQVSKFIESAAGKP